VTAGLTRGDGVVTGTNSAAARGWGGLDWNVADAATAVSSNKVVSFTIAATNGHKLSLSAISKFDYRRSGTGPSAGILQVQVGAEGGFTDVAALDYAISTSGGASLASIDLTTNAALQNIAANTPVTFRIVNFGGTSASGAWYIFDKDINTNLDFEVTGSVDVASAVPPTINSTNAFSGTVGVAFSNTITATGSTPIAFSGTDLPGGLSVATNGVISGTPTAAGPFNATLTASNSVGSTNQAATFTIAKGTPVISVAPTASAITFGQALSNSVLNGGSASPVGTFAFGSPSATPNAGSTNVTVIFTPTDTSNYNPATNTVSVVVNQATPLVTWTDPAAITYGTVLSTNQLNATSSVAGTFTYTPTNGAVVNAGTNILTAVFTAADTNNYLSPLTNTVSLVVNKATPSISVAPTASSVTAGLALSNSTISGGTVNPGGGSWVWGAPSASVTLGTNSYAAIYVPADDLISHWNPVTNSLTVVGTSASSGESIGDFLPPGTPTNAETVGKWLIGGATNFTNASERPVITTNSTNLVLSAIVRTNDPKGQVVGMWVTNLANLPGTNVVTGTRSANQTGFDTNKFERRDFTVERSNGTNRLFLRLKATLQP